MKNKFKVILYSLILSSIAFTGCSNNPDDSSSGYGKSLNYYVGGSDKSNPVYWKNGEKIDLFKPMSSEQYSYLMNKFFKIGNDTYAVGSRLGNSSKAVYWKNNNLMYLTSENDNNIHERALDLYLDGNDLYACGQSYQENDNKTDRAVYWKNGQKIFLTDGLNSGSAYKILKFNNDLYITGNDGSPCYWKNDQKIHVPFYIRDLKVFNNSLYMLGYLPSDTGNITVVWKDGVISQYTNPELTKFSPNEIFIDNKDIYISGTQFLENQIWRAEYLKNGELITLTNNTSATATGIFVKNNVVYVSGKEGNNPMIWIDGIPKILPYTNFGETSNVQVIQE